MNKKIWALGLTAALLLGLAACGGEQSGGEGAGAEPSAAAEAGAATETEADGAESREATATEAPGEGEATAAPDDSAAAEAPDGGEERSPAPDFTLKDGDGVEHSLSDYRGRVVVLNFWASWCGPCQAEMPDFQGLHEIWSTAEDGPVLLAVNLTDDSEGESMEVVKAFLAEEGYTFQVLYDENYKVTSIYTDGSIPTTYIIDQEGYAEAYQVGTVSAEAVQAVVDELLERAEGGA